MNDAKGTTKKTTDTVTVGRLTIVSPTGRSDSALCFAKAQAGIR